ncbi:monocarboxylate transporter 12-like [Tachypleus tridentatus]|uniref:monocarboxylate transporter 12-like n=1 Tax=Tachypleus tridentatus TaxID=6853 RepID=UPI003FD0740B
MCCHLISFTVDMRATRKEKMSNVKANEVGPDKGWSWVVAFAGFLVMMSTFGLFRSAGVLYVAFIDAFHVTRETAAWPFSLCSAVFNLTGLLTGVLLQHFSARTVTLTGVLAASSGVVLCFVASNMAYVTVFIGVIYGFGLGLIMTTNIVIVNKYFKRYRATAVGISMAGSSVGSFVIPPLTEHLLEIYGLYGTFLLQGGIILQGAIGASLYREPSWITKKLHESQTSRTEIILLDGSDEKQMPLLLDEKCSTNTSKVVEEFQDNDSSDVKCKNSINSIELPRDMASQFLKTKEINYNNSTKKQSPSLLILHVEDNKKLTKNEVSGDKLCVLKPSMDVLKFHLLHILGIVKDPMFYVIALPRIILANCMFTFIMVIVDYGKDQGIHESVAVFFLSGFSAADLIGRTTSGWVTDCKLMRRKNVCILTFLAIGGLYVVLPFCISLITIMIVSILMGIFSGTAIILQPVIMTEYLGLENLPFALGIVSFLNAFVSICRSPVIGFFRDYLEKYQYMFYTLGALSVIGALEWSLEPLAIRKKQEIQEETLSSNCQC